MTFNFLTLNFLVPRPLSLVPFFPTLQIYSNHREFKQIKHMIRPPLLRKGDTVGIAAPSSYLLKSELEPGVELIRSWGLQVVIGQHVFRRHNSFAGTDEQRTSDFQAMLDDPRIRAIICARGGYGTVRIIRKLNFEKFLQNPKWIAGCSDITVLHGFLQNLGVESLHSEMPRFVPPAEPDLASMDSLRAALFGETKQYNIQPAAENRTGKSRGILTGGNLSVLYSLAGSDLEPGMKGRILFIEDIGEYLYHIDRMMMNLALRDRLKNLKGLVVGTMNNMMISGSGYRKPAYTVIREAVSLYDFPVMFGFPAGHAHPNISLILGREVEMTVSSKQCTLTF
jgi:muramoyltetrapeptide carboxypeptidase